MNVLSFNSSESAFQKAAARLVREALTIWRNCLCCSTSSSRDACLYFASSFANILLSTAGCDTGPRSGRLARDPTALADGLPTSILLPRVEAACLVLDAKAKLQKSVTRTTLFRLETAHFPCIIIRARSLPMAVSLCGAPRPMGVYYFKRKKQKARPKPIDDQLQVLYFSKG